MTIISNSFSLACRLLLSKYTISTLQSIDCADNQHGYGCIWKFTRFSLKPMRCYVMCIVICDWLSNRYSLLFSVAKLRIFIEVIKPQFLRQD